MAVSDIVKIIETRKGFNEKDYEIRTRLKKIGYGVAEINAALNMYYKGEGKDIKEGKEKPLPKIDNRTPSYFHTGGEWKRVEIDEYTKKVMASFLLAFFFPIGGLVYTRIVLASKKLPEDKRNVIKIAFYISVVLTLLPMLGVILPGILKLF